MPSRFDSLSRRAFFLWVDAVRRRAGPVLVLATALSAAALAYTAEHLGMNTSTTDMLSAELPFRRNAAALRAAFPQHTDTLVVVVEAGSAAHAEAAAERLAAALSARRALFRDVLYLEAHPFFRRHGLLYLEPADLHALSDRLAEAQPLLAALHEDMSLRGLANVLEAALGEGEPPEALARTLEHLASSAEAIAAGTAQPVPWGNLLRGTERTEPASRRRFITLQPEADFGTLEPVAAAVAGVRAAARELGLDEEPGVRVRITGEPLMLQEELESVTRQTGLAGLLSLSLVVGLLIVGLGSARLVLATLASLLVGLAWTASFAAVAVGELNLISVAFAVLFIGLSVDFGIHFALRYRELIDRGEQPGPALPRAAAGVGAALALSAVAAAIGFFAFLPTDYRGVSELGLISGGGMFIALLANLTVLPAILALLPVRPGRAAVGTGAGRRLAAWLEGHGRAVALAAAMLAVAAAAALPFARFDEDPLNLRDPETESVATLLDVLDDPRIEPYAATVLAPDLTRAEALAARLEALPEVATARTLRDFVPEQQDEKLRLLDEMAFTLTPVLMPATALPPPGPAERREAVERLEAALRAVEGPARPSALRLGSALERVDRSAAELERLEAAFLGGLPDRLAELATALEARRIGLEDLPPDLRERRVAADGQATIEIIPAEDLRDAAARERFVAAVQRIAPSASGEAITITEASGAVVRAFQQAALYALAAIALLLLALLHSLRDSLLVLSPLVLAALLTVAATVVFDVPFNLANVIVLPLLLGLGVAAGIQIVLRAREAPRGRVLDTSTPRAVLFSALTTIGSFGSLALSGHPGTASMGLLLTVAIGLTMLCTLLVLPALLAWLDRRAADPAGP